MRRPATFSPRDLITLVTAFAAWQQPLQPPQHAQHAQLGGGVQKLALPIGLQQAFGERLWAPQVVSPGGVGRAAQVARSVLTLLDTCTQGEGQLSDAVRCRGDKGTYWDGEGGLDAVLAVCAPS